MDQKIIRTLGEYGQNLAASPNEIAIANVIALVITELQQKPAPEAYMGYALYDSDSVLYEQGKVILSKKARNKHEELIQKLAVKKDGFIETYLVNEPAENVWFDQFRIMSTGPLIVQETHYDPWGVELSGLGYQYGGIKINPYLYNGKEANGHLGVNLFDYGARLYDPAIGRWFVVDPMAEKAPDWTPYRYGFNNPMKYTDPTGMFEYVKGGYGEDIEVGNVWSHTEDGDYLTDKMEKSEDKKTSSSSVVSVNTGDQEEKKKATSGVNNCPDCGKMHKDATVMEIGGVNVTIAPLGNFSIGLIRRQNDGEWRIILSVGPSAGLDGSIGVFAGTIKNAKNEQLEFSTLEGLGVSDSYSAGIWDFESGSNSIRGRYGESYRSSTVGVSAGSPVGYSRNYSYTYTFDLKRFVLGK